ncbi:ExbD/TolR family protein, partial [Puniceibacterium confluentis]
MINVVFLLLIFFLMTAQITAPPPFDLTLPHAAAQDDSTTGTLYISASGDLAYQTLRGPAALVAAAARTPLTLQADARLSASTLARVLGELSGHGARD